MRMELPLLTLCGEAFASRMAGSLLTTLGRPEGIATSHADYIAKAIKLATDPDAYRRFHVAFTHAAWARSVGDIERFTADFETTLLGICQQSNPRIAEARSDTIVRHQPTRPGPANDRCQDTIYGKNRTATCHKENKAVNAISDESKSFINENGLTRFHLGCGANFLRGWLNVDYWKHLDQGRLYGNPNGTQDTILLNHDLRLGIPVDHDKQDAIYHSHLLEHLTYFEGLDFLKKCHDALRPDGIHRLIVPDLEAFATAYLTEHSFLLEKYKEFILRDNQQLYQTKASIFMGMLHNHGHKCGYDWETLRWALERAGFKRIRKVLFQESDMPDISAIEPYSPVRALESICVECYK